MKKHLTPGFTLVELLVVIAILGIISAIAMPTYNRYIERGYLSQAHAELVSINNGFKNELIKNPTLLNTEVEEKLSSYIDNFSGDPAVAEKYSYSGAQINQETSRRYHLIAAPNSGTGYTWAVAMDSLGNAYKCPEAELAENFLTEQTISGSCEKF